MRFRGKEYITEDFRRELVESNGGPWVGEILDQLKRFRFYIETLEKFISDQETAEVASLKTEVVNLSEEAQGEFWLWYYPGHWDDIFRTTLRSSFLISVMSFAEASVARICSDVQIIARARIRVRDLQGNLWERSRLFLEVFGNFTEPESDIWDSVLRVYAVRNLFVHNDGVPKEEGENRIRQYTKLVPGFLETSWLQFEIGPEFIPYVLGTMSSFFELLIGQLRALCARVRASEG